jgi:hypothetical protein
MTNDSYLIVSYFSMVAIGISVAGVTWAYLRRPLGGIARSLSNGNISRILKAGFPAGLIIPALLGFVSVSYTSCGHYSYEQIVSDRSYLIQKNHEQICSILYWIVAALLFWDFVILFIFKLSRANGIADGESRKP